MASFVLIPLAMMAWPVAIAALVIVAIILATRGKHRGAVSVVVATILPVLLWKPIIWAADCTHLALTVELGIGQIGSSAPINDNRFAVYDWSVGFAGGANTFLIHDLTDEIALPAAQHRYPLANENGFGEDCAGKVNHLVGHYYVCTF